MSLPQPNLGELQPDIKNTDVANHLELQPNTLGEHQPDKNLGEHQPNKQKNAVEDGIDPMNSRNITHPNLGELQS